MVFNVATAIKNGAQQADWAGYGASPGEASAKDLFLGRQQMFKNLAGTHNKWSHLAGVVDMVGSARRPYQAADHFKAYTALGDLVQAGAVARLLASRPEGLASGFLATKMLDPSNASAMADPAGGSATELARRLTSSYLAPTKRVASASAMSSLRPLDAFVKDSVGILGRKPFTPDWRPVLVRSAASDLVRGLDKHTVLQPSPAASYFLRAARDRKQNIAGMMDFMGRGRYVVPLGKSAEAAGVPSTLSELIEFLRAANLNDFRVDRRVRPPGVRGPLRSRAGHLTLRLSQRDGQG